MTNDPKEKRCKESLKKLKTVNRSKSEENIVASVFSEYCSSTSIHGIGYLGAADKSVAEKVWWLLVFLLSLIVCIILITKTWIKWKENPVIVSFSQEQTPVWEIPFPAITICPVNKVKQTVYNYTRTYRVRNRLDNRDLRKFWDISLVCNLQYLHGKAGHLIAGKEAIESIKEVAPQQDETIPSFIWKNKEYNYTSNYFSPRLTEEGFCFTFNSLSQEDLYTEHIDSSIKYIDSTKKSEGWTVEEGYPAEAKLDTYPERTLQEGLISGISIELFSRDYHRDYACGNPTSGFKILVHNPGETPKVNQQYIIAPAKKQLTVAVKPNVIATTGGLLSIPVKVRNCYFAQERKLKFFKIYTQNNCGAECFSNVSKMHCGCIPFYAPKDNTTDICGYGNRNCVKEADELILEYSMLESRNEITDEIGNQPEYKIYKECDCLPSCSTLEYSLETFQADYHVVQSMIATNSFNDTLLDKLEISKVDIFFKETQFLALRRSELYGHTDFLANCGGLLGLFMGFSFLSFLEIIYFLTLRIWCRARYKKSKNKEDTNYDSLDTKF